MGKPKKQKKGKDEDFDDEVDLDPLANVSEDDEPNMSAKKTAKKSKKDKKKKTDDWEDDDVEDKFAALSLQLEQNGSLEESKPAKKDKKKKKQKFIEDNESEEETTEMKEQSNKKKGGKSKPAITFDMFMDDDDDDNQMNFDSDQEEKNVEVEMEEEKEKTTAASSTKSKKEKKKKKQKTEDEDIEALLAELDKPTEKVSKKKKKSQKEDTEKSEETMETQEGDAVENVTKENDEEVTKVEVKVVSIDDFDEEEYDKKKKKKKKKEKEKKDESKDVEGELKEDGDEDQEGGTVKTAAQKTKEKKEKEKEKKLKEKQKQLKKEAEKKEGSVEQDEKVDKEEAPEKIEGAEGEDVGEEEGEKENKKKKKKKEKGKEKEEDKKDKKKNKHLAAIKAHLQKVQEEEERLKKEEEERIAREEEALRKIEEAKKLEEEKKRKRKEKEKERKDRLREEGKLLSEKQKQDKRRAEQMLEAMKQQGFSIPAKDEGAPKKRPVYFDKKKKKQQQQSENRESEEKSPSPGEVVTPVIESPTTPSIEAPEAKTKSEEADDVKDAWDAESDDDVQDDWDADEEEKDEKTETAATVIKPPETVKPKEEKEEESESESESEEEEESTEDESSEEESSEEESSEYESSSDEEMTPIEKGKFKINKRLEAAEKRRTTDVLRAPVVCVLGHVDTGKTKILDKLRRTHVQDNEAGGITQQIGATNVPKDAILNQTKMCKEKTELKLPGLLIIDTPGHESFSNLRTRGSSLCDIAILVIDLMHGLEPQTIESIKLLKKGKTPFVVALNKVDRLFQWKTNPTSDVQNTLKKQQLHTKQEFDERAQEVIVQLAEQGLNAALYYENKNPKEYISLVPTSAHTADGMGNLIALICELTQSHLAKRLAFCEELQATVMEVKALPGLGTTIDVCLVNGTIREGDTIVIAGTGGPIVTQIRGLLMPQPMKELRVKNQYEHHKEVMAAQGVKIIAKDLETSLAGLPLYVSRDDDETEFYKNEVNNALKAVLHAIKLSERGVFVQASTIGSLEALVEFLKTSKIPFAGINIGPVHKKDVIKASVMLEHDSLYATILAFDVKVEREAQEHADNLGVKVFTADIIYHLFDNFIAYREDLKKQKQEEFKHIAVFPCKLKILPQYIFNSRDPIVMGVSVEAGFVKVGIPLCVPSKEGYFQYHARVAKLAQEKSDHVVADFWANLSMGFNIILMLSLALFLSIGIVTSVEVNHKPQEIARKGAEVCIKIDSPPGDSPKMFGRHFDETDMLVSKISRESIDAVKNYFRDDMLKQDWQLIVELKKMFEII